MEPLVLPWTWLILWVWSCAANPEQEAAAGRMHCWGAHGKAWLSHPLGWAANNVAWFYDFWLSLFHIITSCSVLGVKRANALVPVFVRKRRRNYVPQKTVWVLLSFLLRGTDIRPVGHLSLLPSSRLIALAFGSSRCCSRLQARLQY